MSEKDINKKLFDMKIKELCLDIQNLFCDGVKLGKLQETQRILGIIEDMKEDINNLNEENHLKGIQEIFEKSEVSENSKMIKIAFETEMFIIDKLIQKIKDGNKS